MGWNDKIKLLRKDHKLTQEDLATKLKVDRSTVANWEQGRRKPDADVFTLLARVFDVSLEYLLDTPVADESVRSFMRQAESILKSSQLSDADKDKIVKDIMDLYFRAKG